MIKGLEVKWNEQFIIGVDQIGFGLIYSVVQVGRIEISHSMNGERGGFMELKILEYAIDPRNYETDVQGGVKRIEKDSTADKAIKP